MTEEARRRDKLVGVSAAAALLFNPPLLDLFSGRSLFGLPSLYLYLFLAWGGTIAAMAVVVERWRRATARADGED